MAQHQAVGQPVRKCVRVVEKAFAYITNGNRLLVFEHVGLAEAGIQVPAGSVLPGEIPAAAAIREAHEETGLSGFENAHFLGTQEFDARPFAKDEIHHRHFFHIPLPGTVNERWRWFESDPSDGSESLIEFELYWVSLAEAKTCLGYSHDAMIHSLSVCCPTRR
jgi:8-oxo-dGTP diphosphatase